jgi:hypothetical protein
LYRGEQQERAPSGTIHSLGKSPEHERTISMNKSLSLALAATAVAATSSAFVSTAEAGGRGGFRFHFHSVPTVYSAPSESYTPRRKTRVIVKQVTKYVEKPAPAAKTADAQGRQFDPVSKTWFDGKGQCWSGDKPFAFKTGSWFYGDARWVETSSGWGVSTGGLPQQVSCDGIKAFSAKIEQAQAKPIEAKPAKVAEASEPKTEAVEKPAKVATSSTDTPAKTSECKKYFPSVGEMVSVPCSE